MNISTQNYVREKMGRQWWPRKSYSRARRRRSQLLQSVTARLVMIDQVSSQGETKVCVLSPKF